MNKSHSCQSRVFDSITHGHFFWFLSSYLNKLLIWIYKEPLLTIKIIWQHNRCTIFFSGFCTVWFKKLLISISYYNEQIENNHLLIKIIGQHNKCNFRFFHIYFSSYFFWISSYDIIKKNTKVKTTIAVLTRLFDSIICTPFLGLEVKVVSSSVKAEKEQSISHVDFKLMFRPNKGTVKIR